MRWPGCTWQGRSRWPGAPRVVFDNDDTAPHTVAARSGGVDSGVLDPGRQFSVTVTEGFGYFCTIHPSMTAKIAVTG